MNYMQQFIQSQIDLSKSRESQYRNHKDNGLQELRIISAGGIRCSGTTTMCANMFDPSKDIYVCGYMASLHTFNELLINLGKTNTKKISFKYFTMSNNYSVLTDAMKDKVIKKLSCGILKSLEPEFEKRLIDMSIEYPPQLRGKHIQDDANIWFDLGNCISLIRMNEILEVIKFVDKIQGNGTQRYIIL